MTKHHVNRAAAHHAFHRVVVAVDHLLRDCDYLAGSLSPAGALLLASAALNAVLHPTTH